MELRQLHYFTVLAEELHFTRAAGRLHLVQSALSTSVQSLERELGATLIARGGKRLRLTAAGQAFLVEARRTLAAAEAARDAVAAVQGVLTGTLSIGYMPAPDSYDLAHTLGRFHHAHPGVTLRLRNVPSAELVEQVRDHRLDLAFVSTLDRPPRGVRVETLRRSAMPLACAKSHRLGDRRTVSLQEIVSETFIDFVTGWGVRTAVDELLAQARLHRTTAFEVNDIPLGMNLVAQGLGVAFVPPEVVTTYPEVHYLTVDPAPLWHIGLAHLERPRMSAAGRAMLDLINSSPPPLQQPSPQPLPTGASRAGEDPGTA